MYLCKKNEENIQMITRILEQELKNYFFKRKAIILLGPRQVGKTTLIRKLADEFDAPVLYLDGDEVTVRNMLGTADSGKIKQSIGNYKIVVIDEAQRIDEIGLVAKIIVDQFKDVQLVLSGSSAFELTQKMNEPLTGRKFSFQMWPVSWTEFEMFTGHIKSEQELENRLLFGFYPDIIMQEALQERLILELTDSYLFKDILMYGNIRKPEILHKLLQALAWQIGHEVNYKELGDLVGVDSKTISYYIDLLEKTYVIFKLSPFSRNLRNEIKSSKKIYFYDNGIRNALIGDFAPIARRNDIGALWENFVISELVKQNSYQNKKSNLYFWRTKQQQEIDLIEEHKKTLKAYEIKWSASKKVHFSKTFTGNYKAETYVINRENFRTFIAHKDVGGK